MIDIICNNFVEFLISNMAISVFLLVALVHTLFYTIYRDDIFEWHADPNNSFLQDGRVVTNKKREDLKLKIKLIRGEINNDKPPRAWVIEHYFHVFIGLVLGWTLWGILFYNHGIFTGQINVSNLEWSDLILSIGGWIGINGRLPTIAHDVQNWFKK